MALDDDGPIAKYSCDSCRDSKVTCSREQFGCKRCNKNNTECVYSRSGVIRRNRKRKHRVSTSENPRLQVSAAPETEAELESNSCGVQGLLVTDLEAARELSSLSEACATAGTDGSQFHLFEEHAPEWAEVFETFIRERSALTLAAPADVASALRAGRPDRVRGAWLVIYFSIILGTISCETTKQKVQHNMSLALSDIAVLLIPSELNINALILALTQASEFMGPSSCWMIATSACRMFQALGNTRLDPESRERRKMLFWHLNLFDKGFALIFGRAPTFHKRMTRDIGLPTLKQTQGFMSHQNGHPEACGAHYMYQKILLTHLMDDIWDCVYGEAESDDKQIESINNDLKYWHDEAHKVLGAASLTEKPFCDVKHARSIDIAIHTIRFHFLYLSILLSRSSACMEQCLDSCREMLHLLPEMAESKEPYHPITWELVCCPFTPFLVLLCDLLSRENSDLDQERRSLAALEQLPGYLKALGSRNALAARLEGISTRLVHHAQSHLSHVGHGRFEVGPDPGSTPRSATGTCYSSWGILPDGRICEMDIGNPSESNIPMSPILTSLRSLDFELDDDLVAFVNNFDVGVFDWLNWEAQGSDGAQKVNHFE